MKMIISPIVQEEMDRMEKELRAKGVRIIDDPAPVEVTAVSELVIKQPKTETTDWDQAVNNVSVVEEAPIQDNSRFPFNDTQTMTAIVNNNKFKEFYNHILDSGLYINPRTELQFDVKKEFAFDDAGMNMLPIPKEAYNANLTFTILTSLLQNTSQVYFGPPGSGKTTTAEFVLSGMYNIPLSVLQKATIYGHPELTEEKMLAFVDIVSYLKNHEEVIGVRDFMKAPARIIDEVNRIPPGKLSILYQILDRGWTVYNNQKIIATPGPMFATANAADSGNYEIPPAFVDRFDIGVVVDHINSYFIDLFAKARSNKIRYIEDEIIRPRNPIEYNDIVEARKAIYYGTNIDNDLTSRISHFLAELNSCDKAGVSIDKKTKGHALFRKPGQLCKDCSHYSNDKNICRTTENGLSPRTISTIYAYSKALSWWRGNQQVSEEDVKQVLAQASWFKLIPTRHIIDQEEMFINDREAMVSQLWDVSTETYNETVDIFPQYKDISTTIVNYYMNGIRPDKSILEDMMNNMKKIDSTAKFEVGIALRKMYMDHDRR